MPREKSCGAVVFKRTPELEYLLLHYKSGHWDFVKGNIESNENERDTVKRELREETAITKAEFVGRFREKISYFYRRGGQTIYKEVIYFIVQADEEDVKLSFEHIGYTWLNYDKAMKRLTFRTARDVLQRAHRFLLQQYTK